MASFDFDDSANTSAAWCDARDTLGDSPATDRERALFEALRAAYSQLYDAGETVASMVSEADYQASQKETEDETARADEFESKISELESEIYALRNESDAAALAITYRDRIAALEHDATQVEAMRASHARQIEAHKVTIARREGENLNLMNRLARQDDRMRGWGSDSTAAQSADYWRERAESTAQAVARERETNASLTAELAAARAPKKRTRKAKAS